MNIMFGATLIIVGNITNTQVAAAVTEATRQGEADGVSAATAIRVHQWAWLGDWIETAKVAELLGRWDKKQYPNGRIAGAPNAEHFYLDLGHIVNGGITPDPRECAAAASMSLLANDQDELRFVYGAIVSEATMAKENCRLMLSELARAQREIFELPFSIRVFVIRKDGTVKMTKLT